MPNDVLCPPRFFLAVYQHIPDFYVLERLMREAGLAVHALSEVAQVKGLAGQPGLPGLPELVVLDAHMAGGDGLAACREWRADTRTSHIPIAFISAAGQVQDRIEGLSAGALEYIAAPWDPDETRARLLRHVGRARARCPAGAAAPCPKEDSRSPEEELIWATKEYLRGGADDAISTCGLAAKVGVRESRLNDACHAVFGRSLHDFLREHRLERATVLLEEGALKVLEISEQLGFSSAANFSTAFKLTFGCSPLGYRTRTRAGIRSGPAMPCCEVTP